MSTIFISDLHLSVKRPEITDSFMRFLKREVFHAESLYILGDFFDTWIGDDDPEPLHLQVAEALKSLHQKGINCYFIHGNRDFLLGKNFADQSEMILLTQEKIVTLYGRKILLLHGDTLCIDDIAYKYFRRVVYNPLIQRFFLCLPFHLRYRIAMQLRYLSRQRNINKSGTIMDINQKAVIDALQRNRVDWMIHGHTHRPAINSINLSIKKSHIKTLHQAVLGSWNHEGSMIKVSSESIELIRFPL